MRSRTQHWQKAPRKPLPSGNPSQTVGRYLPLLGWPQLTPLPNHVSPRDPVCCFTRSPGLLAA